MAIKTVCPECQTDYHLPDTQAGKRVRCKNCETLFTVEAASRQTAVRGDSPASPARGKSAPPTMMARRPDPDDLDEENGQGQPRKGSVPSVEKKSAMPLLLVTAVVVMGVLLLLSGAAITYLVMKPAEVVSTNPPPTRPPQRDATPPPPVQPTPPPVIQPPPKTDSPPIQPQPVQSVKPVPPTPPPDVPTKGELKPENKEENPGRLTAERRERVKRATVFLRVKSPDGSGGTGSGFFGCKEAPSIVLTNAHVVGMLSPDSPRPLKVEVIVNSGEANEWKTEARILGVDRATDLAVLDIGTPPQPVPDPLVVKGATRLSQLDEVYVFGFPLGEELGKEITIRPASVSVLRKNVKSGVIERIQVNGGMDEGNSGGPVVDSSGAVVGVAVAGYRGRQINFAIPGERVQAILSGRIADLIVLQPYFTEANKVAVPLALGTIDPRNRIKEVGLELWTGDKPADNKSGVRPEAAKQPPKQSGDSQHVYYPLKYLAPEGKAAIVLPDLPPGKVYWHQPRWVNEKGETHWEMGKPLPELRQPVYRKPAKLELHFSQGAKRSIDLTHENIFKLSESDDTNSARIRTTAQLLETVTSTGSGVTQMNLRYRFAPSRELILPDGKSYEEGSLEQVKNEFPRVLISVIQMDARGNITKQAIDPRPLLQLQQTNPRHAKLMTDFHESIQQGLEALSVALPPGGTVNPGGSWKAERHLPIETPGKSEIGKIDVTFTYEGTRRRDGREEAVITMDGVVRGKDNAVGGKASGQILVDLASGQTLLAETTVTIQLKARLSRPGEQDRELRVIATMNFKMVRKRMV